LSSFDRSNGRRHEYAYDAFGRRIRKIVDADGVQDGPSETRFFYGGVSQRQVIEEQDGNDNTRATYVPGDDVDELMSMDRDTNGDAQFETYFYHTDDLGNVMTITDEFGEVMETYEYGDFGSPQFLDAKGIEIPQSATGNPYLFQGREFDSETALYHYRTRYLDPVIGRFISRDLIRLWGDVSQFGNAHSFVGNRSWTVADPARTFQVPPHFSPGMPSFREYGPFPEAPPSPPDPTKRRSSMSGETNSRFQFEVQRFIQIARAARIPICTSAPSITFPLSHRRDHDSDIKLEGRTERRSLSWSS